MESWRPQFGGKIAVGLIAVLAASALVLGVSAWNRADTRDDSIADLRDFQQLAVEDPNRALTQCDRSQPTIFSALAAQLADDEDSFGDDRFQYRKNGLTYLSANLLDGDGATKASTPVWIYGGAGFASLSTSASRASTLIPDARNVYQANPYGESATRVKTCVIAAARAADQVGGR